MKSIRLLQEESRYREIIGTKRRNKEMEKPWVLLIDIDRSSAELIGQISVNLGYEVLLSSKLTSAKEIYKKVVSEVAVFQVGLADATVGQDYPQVASSQSTLGWIFIDLRHPLFGELFAEMERAGNVSVKDILARPLTEGPTREALSKDG